MALPNGYQDAAQVSSAGGVITPPEMYIPLWWYSGNGGSVGATTTAGSEFVIKGNTSFGTSPTQSSKSLHTLNSSWNPNNKYAFEVNIYTSVSSNTAYAQLWDLTSNTAVSGTQLSTNSTTAITLRSGQFTLTPGHVYGITIWENTGTIGFYVTDASLIVFPS